MLYESTGEFRIPKHGEFFLAPNATLKKLGDFNGKRYGKGWHVIQMWCCDDCTPNYWGKAYWIMKRIKK